MKLVKFRVKNYRSIIDSLDCYLENDITILAGKNEAGKTALLEALADFNINTPIRDKAKPLFKKDKLPEISVTFIISKQEVEEMFEASGLLKGIKVSDANITITKSFPDVYSISDDSSNPLGIYNKSEIDKHTKSINDLYEDVKAYLSEYPEILNELPPLDSIATSEKVEEFNRYKDFVTQNNEKMANNHERDVLYENISKIINVLDSLLAIQTIKNSFESAIKAKIPNFILFSSFNDVFPSEITIEDVKNNELIKDLDIISDLKLDTVANGEPAEKMKHNKQLNMKIETDYKRYWTQNISPLRVNWDNNVLHFFIEEHGEFYPPEVRSQGKRWHLAFYIRVSARSNETKENVLLIDEPGLFLHATAQRDILLKLKDAAKKIPIIFTTHSPYLLETDGFQHIRLVQRGMIPRMIEESQLEEKSTMLENFYDKATHKKNEAVYYKLKKRELEEEKEDELRTLLFSLGYNLGTTVEAKIHKVADKETLTPLLTAIGLELASGIVNVDKKNNVVTEGQSDVYYMQAFKRILPKFPEINFVFGGGANNIPMVGTILSGWGCNVLYLYDNDSGKKNAERKLRKEWLLDVDNVLLTVIDIEEASIEDVFSKDDFIKYVLQGDSISYDEKNSTYIKSVNKDKVLLAKCFLQLTEKETVTLSSETTENIKELTNEIKKKFASLF